MFLNNLDAILFMFYLQPLFILVLIFSIQFLIFSVFVKATGKLQLSFCIHEKTRHKDHEGALH